MKISNRAVETLIGGLVLLVIFNFGMMLYENKGSKSGGGETYILQAYFDRIDGISVGSPVMVSGIQVGEVVSSHLDVASYSAVLGISIKQEVKLPVDTLAEIVSTSLLGDKYVSLVPGADSEMLKNDDKIEFTQSSISFENLISKMVFGMDSSKGKDNLPRAEMGNEIDESEEGNGASSGGAKSGADEEGGKAAAVGSNSHTG